MATQVGIAAAGRSDGRVQSHVASMDPGAGFAPAGAAAQSTSVPWLWALWTIALGLGAVTYVLPLSYHAQPLSYLTAYWDDFFYYLQIARNIATDFRSTFDGISLTNGYHPLWLIVLTAFCAVFDPAEIGFHYAVGTGFCVLQALTAHAIFRYVSGAFGAAPRHAFLIALIVLPFYAFYAHGMEIVLAVPLILAFALAGKRFVDVPSPRRLLAWSAIGSLCILARLDSAIGIALIGGAVAMQTPAVRLREWLTGRMIVAGLLGMTPLAVYVAVNAVLFGALTPVSGQAKHLADFPVMSFAMLNQVFVEPFEQLFEGRVGRFIASAVIPATATVLALATWRRSRPEGAYWRAVHLAFLVFPFAHIAVLFLVSDWVLWPWYYYPFVPALASAVAAARQSADRLDGEEGAAATVARAVAVGTTFAISLVAFVFALLLAKPTSIEARAEYGIADASVAVSEFAATHDGLFAMGDRGGRVGFLVPNRVMQLEGLVGSAAFLDSIRGEAELLDVLRQHGVRYYVGTRMPRQGACHVANEPRTMQAGEKSPRMSGLFCAEPVFRHVDFRNVVTLIFDLRREEPKPASR